MKTVTIIISLLLIMLAGLILAEVFNSLFVKASDYDARGVPPDSARMERYISLQEIALRVADTGLFSVLLYLVLFMLKQVSDKQFRTKYFLANILTIILFPFFYVALTVLIQLIRENM